MKNQSGTSSEYGFQPVIICLSRWKNSNKKRKKFLSTYIRILSTYAKWQEKQNLFHEDKLNMNLQLNISLTVGHCYLLSLITRCYSLDRSFSFVIARCYSLSLVLPLLLTRCHSIDAINKICSNVFLKNSCK